jgi:hypothetical protein
MRKRRASDEGIIARPASADHAGPLQGRALADGMIGDMKHKILDVILLLAVLIGRVLAWRTGEERGRLTERHRRLAQVTGDLPIEDPSKVYVLALETGERLHYTRRVYCPTAVNVHTLL